MCKNAQRIRFGKRASCRGAANPTLRFCTQKLQRKCQSKILKSTMTSNMKRILLFISLALTGLACGESNNNPSSSQTQTALPIRTVANLQADTANTGRFTFFSLRDSAIVPNSDSATARWDIAFAPPPSLSTADRFASDKAGQMF
jgi:hypothetical protein